MGDETLVSPYKTMYIMKMYLLDQEMFLSTYKKLVDSLYKA